jgi:hypothetical protein
MGGRRTHTKRAPATTTTTTTTRTTRTHGAHGVHGTHGRAAPVHHHKRHATMGDKVSGMMMKLRGSLTRRPGLKVSYNRLTNTNGFLTILQAAGTRRMHGTDGRNARHYY